ncbi:MAG: hypothetical protein K2Q12_07090 [Rickettsiales bacterium]|nr:hypothetical protein [Rickettsiales bacterium]
MVESPEDDVSEEHLGKLESLFFDPSKGYGTAALRVLVEEVINTHSKVIQHLDRTTSPEIRRHLQNEGAYGDPKQHLSQTLEMLFDAAFDHGVSEPKQRFLDAVKALGMDDGQDEGVTVASSAEHYYLLYREQLVRALVAKAELQRVANRYL